MGGGFIDQRYVCFAATAELVAEPGGKFETAGAAAHHDNPMPAR
jgi:hypothetical protein